MALRRLELSMRQGSRVGTDVTKMLTARTEKSFIYDGTEGGLIII